jgi:hypothetical protein
MEYKILENKELNKLIEEVNKLINEGWKPQGGASYSDRYYIQAMIKF